MKRDGTIYLAHVKFPNRVVHWELVHWGRPVAMSNPNGELGWCNQIGFALKEPVFLKAFALADIHLDDYDDLIRKRGA